MIPLADTHCHLLAGLDDGPRTMDEAVQMCRIAYDEGTRVIAATAHINDQWPEVTPERIRAATRKLAARLEDINLPLTVYPCAEVTISPDMADRLERGELLSVSDYGVYLLMELPAGVFLNLCDLIQQLQESGIRPILAHPERQARLLHDPGLIEELIELGCLVQVTASSITRPSSRKDTQMLKHWVQRGIVHLVGSDGHSPRSRAPRMVEAHRRITHWAGATVADQICGTNGYAVLEGLSFHVPKPEPAKKSWFSFSP